MAWQHVAAGVHSIQQVAGVGSDPFGDVGEGLRVGATAVLDRRADHPAGVGHNVGHVEDAPLGEHRLGAGGDGQVGALEHHWCAYVVDIALVDGVRLGGGYEHVALYREQIVAADGCRIGKSRDRTGSLARHQRRHVQSVRVVHGPGAVGDRDDSCASLGELKRRVLAHCPESPVPPRGRRQS